MAGPTSSGLAPGFALIKQLKLLFSSGQLSKNWKNYQQHQSSLGQSKNKWIDQFVSNK